MHIGGFHVPNSLYIFTISVFLFDRQVGSYRVSPSGGLLLGIVIPDELYVWATPLSTLFGKFELEF